MVVRLVTHLLLPENLCRLGLYSSCSDLGAGIYYKFFVVQLVSQCGSILSLSLSLSLSLPLLLLSPKPFVHFYMLKLSDCF